MPIGLLLVIILVILFVGSLPTWPYTASYGWGYYPPGIFGLILVVLLVLLLLGRI